MSQYTISLQSIINIKSHQAPYNDDVFADTRKKISRGREIFFNFDYEGSEKFKELFENAFIINNLDENIFCYDADLFLLALENDVKIKAPLYYKKYQAIDSLIAADLELGSKTVTDGTDERNVDEHRENVDTGIHSERSVNSHSDTTSGNNSNTTENNTVFNGETNVVNNNNSQTTDSTTATTTDSSTTNGKTKTSQFPQDIVNSGTFNDVEYMDAGSASQNTTSSTSTNTSSGSSSTESDGTTDTTINNSEQQTSESNGESSSSSEGESTTNVTGDSRNAHNGDVTHVDKGTDHRTTITTISKIDKLNEYMMLQQNVINEFVKSLSNLFMLIW